MDTTPQSLEENKPDLSSRIKSALDCATCCGQIDGSHHRLWCIDQMIRCLTGCPVETREATDWRGNAYTHEALGESAEYQNLIAEACHGEYGPNTYEWDTGCPP